MEHTTSTKSSPGLIQKIAALIVDKRKAFYFIYIGLAIFCAFSYSWVQVDNDLTNYLSPETETRQGLTAHGRGVYHLCHRQRHG